MIMGMEEKMKHEEKIKMFKDVFAPKSGEKVLFLIDIPHDRITDNNAWKERRVLAQEWYTTFKEMGAQTGFSVNILKYKATGMQNSPVPDEIINAGCKSNLVIAITEYSATASLIPVCTSENSITRCASMPGVERRMEETAFRADYQQVKKYATTIAMMLNDAVGAEIVFSTGEKLYIDLRNRVAEADTGDCTQTGQFINFPSGEAAKVPYEAAQDEINAFGESKTQGIWPVIYEGELVKYIIKNNRIVEIIGNDKKAEEMRLFFKENDTRRNIAELGIGCNPKAVITGNVLEDEKVGLHIAYGMSIHLGGKVKSDVHEDICYSKGCPVEGTTVVLLNADGSKTEIIRNAILRYDLLR
jgi:leucyl aminopeptidase (aminopeptidase T)